MVNSAAMSVSSSPITPQEMLTGRPVIYAALSVLAMLMVGYVDVRRLYTQRGLLNPVAWLLLISAGLCAMVLAPGLGRSVNGASRWLYIGPRGWNLSFQPSELAKWAMVLAMAWWGARRAGAMRSFVYGFGPALMILGVVCGLVVIEDLGTAVLIGAVGVLVLVAAGARVWQAGLLIPPAVAGVAALIAFSPYRMRRITSFIDPWADPQGAGYHLVQSLNTIQEGGLTGRGLGNSVFKFGYLPEDTTDFLFAVICGELGAAGAFLVVAIYVGMMAAGLAVVRECRHAFGRLLGLGVLLTIGLQAMINLAVVTGLIPTKGIALPLLSNGGTGWVMTSAAVGLLVAIDRINRMESSEAESESDEMDIEPAPLSISATTAAA